jgi:hypothetical protein
MINNPKKDTPEWLLRDDYLLASHSDSIQGGVMLQIITHQVDTPQALMAKHY